jgi:hypothetical protein
MAESRSKPHPPNWVEKWTLFFEVTGIIGLGIYCYYTFLEWKTFDSERKTMETEVKDNEAQQRAVLHFRKLYIKQILSTNQITGGVEDTFVGEFHIKNEGFTPAEDLQYYITSIFEDVKTNDMHGLYKWNGKIPKFKPGDDDMRSLSSSLMPQETITNGVPTITLLIDKDKKQMDMGYYDEMWLTYYDIFGHLWIIGEGGVIYLKSNLFEVDFYAGPFPYTNEPYYFQK